jgi:hypothetical protein
MTPPITKPPRTSATATALIQQVLHLLGPNAELVGAREREWASVSFAGARHSIDVRVRHDVGDVRPLAMLMALSDVEFTLLGEIVADCSVTHDRGVGNAADHRWLNARIELLTVDAD